MGKPKRVQVFMQYPFETLETLLKQCGELMARETTNTAVQKLLQQAANETAYCKQYFMRFLFHLKSKKQLKLFIQSSQLALVALHNKFYTLLETGQGLIPEGENVLQELGQLLDFLALHFSQTFDRQQQSPIYYSHIYMQETERKFVFCKETILKEKARQKDWEMLIKVMELLLKTEPEKQYSFHQLFYIRSLIPITEQRKLFADEAGVFNLGEIYLLKQGFNEEHFLEYIRKKMSVAAPAKQPVQYWQEQRKLIIQLQKQKKAKYCPQQPDASAVLLKFAEAELHYQEDKARQNQMGKGKSAKNSNPAIEKLFTSSMPVGQFAVVLRLLIEGGHIKPLNLKTFLYTIANSASLDNQQHISPESLRNKYYSPERSALQGVKDLLFGCIKEMGRLG
jgi:hypothetical protein